MKIPFSSVLFVDKQESASQHRDAEAFNTDQSLHE
jgi:hypothetical protein